MKNNIKISTNETIFLIHYNFESGKKDLCNSEHLEKLIKKSKGIKKIERLDNGIFVRISRKDIKVILENQGMNTEFLNII